MEEKMENNPEGENQNPENAHTPESMGSESAGNPIPERENTPESTAPKLPAWIDELAANFDRTKGQMAETLVGQQQMVELLYITMLCEGHALVEGVPGIAKTLTTKLFAASMGVDFRRIQFTPDLMPSDVLGTMVFNMKESEFNLKKGPIFSNVVLIDEINRAPAKTQAALFEVMEERQVTLDGTTYPMQFPFMVLATQNPIEQEGTYKLPEAQLDRFLFRILVDFPSFDEEVEILKRFSTNFNLSNNFELEAVISPEKLKAYAAHLPSIHASEEILTYIARLMEATRTSPDLFLGASPRASLGLMKAAKARAALNKRAYVVPDDVTELLEPVLNHRVIMSPERELEGYSLRQVISEIVKSVPVPR